MIDGAKQLPFQPARVDKPFLQLVEKHFACALDSVRGVISRSIEVPAVLKSATTQARFNILMQEVTDTISSCRDCCQSLLQKRVDEISDRLPTLPDASRGRRLSMTAASATRRAMQHLRRAPPLPSPRSSRASQRGSIDTRQTLPTINRGDNPTHSDSEQLTPRSVMATKAKVQSPRLSRKNRPTTAIQTSLSPSPRTPSRRLPRAGRQLSIRNAREIVGASNPHSPKSSPTLQHGRHGSQFRLPRSTPTSPRGHSNNSSGWNSRCGSARSTGSSSSSSSSSSCSSASDINNMPSRSKASSSSKTTGSQRRQDRNRRRRLRVRTTKSRPKKHNASQIDALEAWYQSHIDDPYPDTNEKMKLAQRTGLTYDQVGSWFINVRLRRWKRNGAHRRTNQRNNSRKPQHRKKNSMISSSSMTNQQIKQLLWNDA
jgi:Homeobox KN domain